MNFFSIMLHFYSKRLGRVSVLCWALTVTAIVKLDWFCWRRLPSHSKRLTSFFFFTTVFWNHNNIAFDVENPNILGICLRLFGGNWFRLCLPKPATIDLALARPTLNVVRGSRRGGAGAGLRPEKATIYHKNVWRNKRVKTLDQQGII